MKTSPGYTGHEFCLKSNIVVSAQKFVHSIFRCPGYKQERYFVGKKKLVLILDENALNPYRTRILCKIKYWWLKNFTQNILRSNIQIAKIFCWEKKKTLFNFVQKCHRPRILSIIRCSRFCSKTCSMHFWKSLIQIAKRFCGKKKTKKQNKTQFNLGRKCQQTRILFEIKFYLCTMKDF